MVTHLVDSQCVERLVRSALDGMTSVIVEESASGGEVFSACMTLALKAMLSAKDMGQNLEPFRAGLERMYALLPTNAAPVN